jgi:hypothetical protein
MIICMYVCLLEVFENTLLLHYFYFLFQEDLRKGNFKNDSFILFLLINNNI